MTMTLERFQGAANERTRQPGRRPKPYDTELRAFAIDYVDEQVAEGRSQAAAVGELGISYQTLKSWRDRGEAPQGGFRRVTVAEAIVETSSAVVVSPKGYRVEGLGVGDIATLLEKLG